MLKWMCLAAALGFVLQAPAVAKSKTPAVPDQVIASWTEKDPKLSDARTEHSLSLHAGILLETDMLYGPLYPDGNKSEFQVKLARIKAMNTNHFNHDDGTVTYRIGVDSKGAHDIASITHERGIGTRAEHLGSVWGFLTFAPDQKSVRDEVYSKLCALMSPGVCVGEWK